MSRIFLVRFRCPACFLSWYEDRERADRPNPHAFQCPRCSTAGERC